MDGFLTYGQCLARVENGVIFLRGGGNSNSFYSNPISTNTWYHVVMVRDTFRTDYYLDGQFIGSENSGTNNSASTPYGKMVFGTDRTRSRSWFDGKIDDIKIYNCAFSDSAVSALYDQERAISRPNFNCIVARYDFNGNAFDSTGNGNNGTINGATPTTDRFGNPNSAYEFDGADDWINTNSTFDYQQRTVSVWFNADFINAPGGINSSTILNMDGFLTYGQCIARVENGVMLLRGGGSTSSFFSNSININTWYHLVMVRDTFRTDYYLDGQFIGSQNTGSNNSQTTPYGKMVFGTDRTRSRSWFDGKIDDIKIYDCALSDSAVQALYDEEKPLESPVDTICLEARYDLNGNAIDSTGNGYNGTINGATPTTDRFGNPNSAFEFDGVDDWINTNSTFDYQRRTVSLWFNADFIDAPGGINSPSILNMDGFLTYGQCLARVENGVMFLRGGGSSNSFFSNPIDTNKWYHLVMVRDTTITSYYLNGVLIGSENSGTNNSATTPYGKMVFGTDRTRNRNFFDGEIDDVKIYDCSLSAKEVGDLYDEEKPTSTSSGNLNNSNSGLEAYIFPNPSSGAVNISFSDPDLVNGGTLNIYNYIGQLTFTTKLSGETLSLDTKDLLSSGTYMLEFLDEDGNRMGVNRLVVR